MTELQRLVADLRELVIFQKQEIDRLRTAMKSEMTKARCSSAAA